MLSVRAGVLAGAGHVLSGTNHVLPRAKHMLSAEKGVLAAEKHVLGGRRKKKSGLNCPIAWAYPADRANLADARRTAGCRAPGADIRFRRRGGGEEFPDSEERASVA